MQNTTMLKLTLFLNGHYAGKTIKLAETQFVKGKVVLYGSAVEVNSLANYLGKCYQAWPEGETLESRAKELEDSENGASTIQEKGLSDLGPEIRAEERPPKEVSSNDGAGTDRSDMDERGNNPSGIGHEDPRVPSPEERFDNTSTTKVDPEKLLQAMQMLNPATKEHWRADGQPRIDAVAELYGSEGITRKDLQAIWPELTQGLEREEELETDPA